MQYRIFAILMQIILLGYESENIFFTYFFML